MAFVKFSRGLLSAYNNLSRKDPDTLYLVYESNESTSGSLYLGSKLISSVGSITPTSLNDLSDVSISGSLEDGMLLQYNSSTGEGQWQAVSLSEVVGSLPLNNNQISIAESLSSIKNPNEKDIAVIGNDVYIYTNNNWRQLTNSLLENRVSNLENQVGHAANTEQGISATGLYKDIADLANNVYTKDEIASQIANAGHLKYEIVNTINDIDLTTDDTIYLIPKSAGNADDGYDEYFVINGSAEKIGDWGVDLSGYVQTDDNRLLTSEQKTKLDAIILDDSHNLTIQASQVGGLVETIQANQLIKTVQSGVFKVTEQGELQLVSTPSIELTNYVQKVTYEAEVGDLTKLINRTSPNSTLVDEINEIKESIIWQEMQENS